MTKTTMVALAGILLVGAGCGSGSKSQAGSARLSVSAKAVTAPAAATTSGLDLGAGITINRVRVALSEIGLEATAATSASVSVTTSDDSAGHDVGEDPGEVKVGPFLVDLSGTALAGGSISQVLDADVPAGTYRELRIVVAPVAGATGALATLGGNSVVVDGTVDGAPFTFSSQLISVQKRESTVTADSGSSNVTLTVSPAGWFKASDGSRLDPTIAGNRSAIELNIGSSIDAFDDDNGDGHEDAPGHG
jgi:hypothetical protein